MERDNPGDVLSLVVNIVGLVIAAYWIGRLSGVMEALSCLGFDATMVPPRGLRSDSAPRGLGE